MILIAVHFVLLKKALKRNQSLFERIFNAERGKMWIFESMTVKINYQYDNERRLQRALELVWGPDSNIKKLVDDVKADNKALRGIIADLWPGRLKKIHEEWMYKFGILYESGRDIPNHFRSIKGEFDAKFQELEKQRKMYYFYLTFVDLIKIVQTLEEMQQTLYKLQLP